MKLSRASCSTIVVIFLLLGNASSTILTTTLLTGFMGGFLMGKVTLGTFLAVMNSVNRPQVTGTATQPKVVTRGGGSEEDNQFQDISIAVENQVRDRFLRQLGKMDPLNCLPKVFCEISADPNAAEGLFGDDAKLFGQNLSFHSSSSNKGQNKTTKKSTHSKDNDDNVEDDIEDDNSESQSEEEEDEPYNERKIIMKHYSSKEKHELESQALDELLDESYDPISYYYILKDKQKQNTAQPLDRTLLKNSDLSLGRLNLRKNILKAKTWKKIKRPIQSFRKKIGQSSTSSRKISTQTPNPPTASSSIDDVFANDPFFDDFPSSGSSRSFNNKPHNRFAHIELIRRSKREVIDEHDATLAKYRMAAKIAEKFKNPAQCKKFFNTCPFSSEEVMSMITKLNSDKDTSSSYTSTYTVKEKTTGNKPIKKNNHGLKNLKNTLQAIEKLNDATINAQTNGKPVDYEKLIEEATKSQVSFSADKIVRDFENFEDEIETQTQEIETPPETPFKTSKRLQEKKLKSRSKKRLTRQRRHGGTPPLFQELETIRNRGSRITLEEKNKEPLKQKYTNLDDDCSDEDALPLLTTSIESNLNKRLNLKPLKGKTNQERFVETKKGGGLKSDDEIEDDEVSSPEYEEIQVKIPSFSQTFQETLQNPPRNKTRTRPIHPIVKVKEQYIQKTTQRPKRTTTVPYYRTRPTKAPVVIKHQLVEDDEEEAIESEKVIDALVSKYKPKAKKSPST